MTASSRLSASVLAGLPPLVRGASPTRQTGSCSRCFLDQVHAVGIDLRLSVYVPCWNPITSPGRLPALAARLWRPTSGGYPFSSPSGSGQAELAKGPTHSAAPVGPPRIAGWPPCVNEDGTGGPLGGGQKVGGIRHGLRPALPARSGPEFVLGKDSGARKAATGGREASRSEGAPAGRHSSPGPNLVDFLGIKRLGRTTMPRPRPVKWCYEL